MSTIEDEIIKQIRDFVGLFDEGFIAELEEALKDEERIDHDEDTALLYGRITAELKRKGKHIPTNDIWTAAIAVQYDLAVVTRDKHFTDVNDLTVLTW